MTDPQPMFNALKGFVEAMRVVYQPGDGTRYIFDWARVPSLDDSDRENIISVSTGRGGRSMYISIPAEGEVKNFGFYLHPSYVEEKFGPGNGYLSRVVAHFFNMLYSESYGRILARSLEDFDGALSSTTLPGFLNSKEKIAHELEEYRNHCE